MRSLQLESEIRTNPELRADRWVQDWKRYDSLRKAANNAPDFASADRWGNKLENLANQLHRDPQIDSLIAIRRHELGLYGRASGGGISHDLLTSIGRGRGLGIGIGM